MLYWPTFSAFPCNVSLGFEAEGTGTDFFYNFVSLGRQVFSLGKLIHTGVSMKCRSDVYIRFGCATGTVIVNIYMHLRVHSN